ncbi:MAG: hypothetical protein HY827_01205 [Actinobacteria bacterium]|nr:hypothetical protein [Actinomycetota bacterium]
MNALTIRAAHTSRREHFAGGTFYLAAGGIFGVQSLTISAMIDALAIVVGQRVLGSDVCMDGFNDLTIGLVMGFGLISSFVVGRWLYGLRRWIGDRPEPGAERWSEMIRRRFVWGSMTVYCVGTPVKLLVLLIFASCGGGERLGA